MIKILLRYFLLLSLGFAPQTWATLYLESSNGLKFTDSVDKSYWCKLSLLVKVDSYSFAERYTTGQKFRNNGSRIRKAEISISGNLNNHWGYLFKLDWNTFYTKYSGFGHHLLLYFGQVIIPFGLENACSSKWSPFLERSLATYTFSPGYGIGCSFRKAFCEYNTTLSASLTTSAYSRNKTGHNEPLQKTLRMTYAPIHELGDVLHFGISARYQRLLGNNRLRSRPEIRLRNHADFLSVEFPRLNYCSSIGLEFARLLGAFCVQTEFIKALSPRALNAPLQQCAGGYIQTSYILTGESHEYDFKSGTFGRIRPKTNLGAWEIAYRYSYINLIWTKQNQRNGVEWSNTFSLGWTLNDHVRIFGNFIIARVERSHKQNKMMEIFGLRLQWLY